MKKILIVVSQVYKMGGQEKLALELAENLLKKNIECSILVLYKDPRNKFYSENEKSVLEKFKNLYFVGIRPNPSTLTFLKTIFNVTKILKNYNIVETSDITTSLLISFSSIFLKIKHVFGIHYVYTNEQENSLKFKIWKLILKVQKNIYYYSVSDFAKVKWANYLNSNSINIETIHNSVQDSFFEYKSNKNLNLNLKKDSKIILYVGRLIEFKGFHKILYSIHSLLIPENLSIIFLGDRDPVTKYHKEDQTDRIISAMKQFVNKKKLNSRGLFLGFKNNVKDYIKNADLLMHPTKKESFGLVLVESMALGTPIAASNYEAIPEILKNTNSILFNPNSETEIKESVIKFLNLSDLEKKIMIKKGEERSKDFSQENRTNKMISLYDKIQKLN